MDKSKDAWVKYIFRTYLESEVHVISNIESGSVHQSV